MARKLFLICISSILLLAAVTVFSCNRDLITIAVSPQTLILNFDQGGRVTVHTNINYYTYATKSALKLNGVLTTGTWPDSRGCLVAGFNEKDVEATVKVGKATMTLSDNTGTLGTDTVQVIKKK